MIRFALTLILATTVPFALSIGTRIPFKFDVADPVSPYPVQTNDWPFHAAFVLASKCAGVNFPVESTSCVFEQYLKEQFAGIPLFDVCFPFGLPKIPSLKAIKENLAVAANDCGAPIHDRVMETLAEEVKVVLLAESCWADLCKRQHEFSDIDRTYFLGAVAEHVAQCGNSYAFRPPSTMLMSCLLENYLDKHFDHDNFDSVFSPFDMPETTDFEATKDCLVAAAIHCSESGLSRELDTAVQVIQKLLLTESWYWEIPRFPSRFDDWPSHVLAEHAIQCACTADPLEIQICNILYYTYYELEDVSPPKLPMLPSAPDAFRDSMAQKDETMQTTTAVTDSDVVQKESTSTCPDEDENPEDFPPSAATLTNRRPKQAAVTDSHVVQKESTATCPDEDENPEDFPPSAATLTNPRPKQAIALEANKTVLVVIAHGLHQNRSKTASIIGEHVFVNFAETIYNCSNGKVKLSKAKGDGIVNGIFEFKLDYWVGLEHDEKDIVDELIAAIKPLGGESAFDHVIYALPSGSVGLSRKTQSWVAYSDDSTNRSVFNGYYVTSVELMMHTFGHNLGMANSQRGRNPYGDRTCLMGEASSFQQRPLKCFNAAKHWDLGWYEERAMEIDDVANHNQLVKLVPFVDYTNKDSSKYPVVLKIGNLYAQWNRARSFNSGNNQDQDKVVVVSGEGPKSVSTWQAALATHKASGSRRFSQPNFNNTGFNLVIESCSADKRWTPGSFEYVELSIYLDDVQTSLCGRINATSSPSTAPRIPESDNASTEKSTKSNLVVAVVVVVIAAILVRGVMKCKGPATANKSKHMV